MRTLLASALVLLACGCADRSSRPSGAGALPIIPGGPDPIVLRVPRAGGLMTAMRYPGLDSVLWRATQRTPPVGRVIAFDAEDGFVAAVDTSGRPVRIDLRLGTVSTLSGEQIDRVASADGDAIYVLLKDGDVTRFTANGSDWKYHPALPVSGMFPQADGSLVLVGVPKKKHVLVWRVRPPGITVSDSLSIDVSGTPEELDSTLSRMGTTVGERVFFAAHQEVLAVRSRDLGKALDLNMGETIRAIAATPSGDRLFVALVGETQLRVVDRFQEIVSGKVKLPGEAIDLRMDPLGRFVLVRGAHDSVWVVGVATDDVIGVVHSEWRADLPMVMPDGQMALARGNDVILADNSTLADVRTIQNGARDFWVSLRWNGFRPRSVGLDEPVRFRTSGSGDSAGRADTIRVDSTAADATTRTTSADDRAQTQTTDARDSVKNTNEPPVFTVQFASVLSEESARNAASRIHVNGQSPRVTSSTHAGNTVYRVTMGPFASREEAERVGKAAGQPYWIYEGVP